MQSDAHYRMFFEDVGRTLEKSPSWSFGCFVDNQNKIPPVSFFKQYARKDRQKKTLVNTNPDSLY